MTFTLYVDAEKWRRHLDQVVNNYSLLASEVSPVIKGNGYGLGRALLAAECANLGVKKLAVGTVFELEQALRDFAGDVIVLEPFSPADVQAVSTWKRILNVHGDRIIVTIAGPDLVSATHAGVRRAYLEGRTSMNRFGMTPSEMESALSTSGSAVNIEGLTLHLPISEPGTSTVATLETSARINPRAVSNRVLEVYGWMSWFHELSRKHSLTNHVSISHFTPQDLKSLQALGSHDAFTFGVRLGTSLWLGEPKALTAKGTVLAVHALALEQTKVGYTQVDSHGNSALLVVSGGTSHGVALTAPAPTTTWRRRGIAIAEGLQQAMGKVRSPFTWRGNKLIFAEPPHMHVSMLWCQDSTVKVGDQLTCTVRLTTAAFDQVIGLD